MRSQRLLTHSSSKFDRYNYYLTPLRVLWLVYTYDAIGHAVPEGRVHMHKHSHQLVPGGSAHIMYVH